MTSLSDAYSGTVAAERGRHRLFLGVGLFLVGAVLVVAGILAAGSELLTASGYTLGEARWLAGVLGGIGVPTVFFGVFTILPAGRTVRGTALIGASVAMFGVALFAHAYPCQWIGNTCATSAANLTLPTAGVYFAGTLTTFWCLFTAVANFKTRNDPGGTVTMEVTRQVAESQTDDSDDGFGGLGTVGLFGPEPDGNVATQTNAPSPAGGAATSDGGATAETLSTPSDDASPTSTQSPNTSPSTDTGEAVQRTGSQPAESQSTTASTDSRSEPGIDQVQPTASQRDSPGARSQRGEPGDRTGRDDGGEATRDRYCGSCASFEYVNTDAGMQPYCAHHDELMDDMESCDSWEPRR